MDGQSLSAKDAGLAPNAWLERIGVRPDALNAPVFAEEYPFAFRLCDVGGEMYHYLDEGGGEPVVMVHGNPTWSFFYRNIVGGLRNSYRCLVPDHIGCGLSSKPQRYDYTLARHAANLESWLEGVLPAPSEEGGRINLVVHDWGGPIGLSYAIRHPERIKRVVVLNTSAFTLGTMPLRIMSCRWPVLGEFMVRGLNLFASLATTSTTVKPLAKEVRDGFILPYNSWANRIGVYNFVKDIPLRAGTKTHALFQTLEERIAPLLNSVPLLVQWGMRDWCFTPYFLNIWRERFPRAEIDEYPNAAHYLLEDEGAAILAKIRAFLERPVQ